MICLVPAAAPDASAQESGVGVGDVVQVNALVVGVDKETRTLTLEREDGSVELVQVGDVARNFDQIKVGDRITASYYESVAVYIGAPGETPDVAGAGLMVRAPKGSRPGGYAAEIVDVSATVKKINKRSRKVKLKLPDGRTVTRKVDPSVKNLDELKAGDTVHVRLTKALAISVDS
jgi:hypothetical protein